MSFRSITIRKALGHISRNDYVLPAIQREFVWSTDQIARLFDSVLRDYPIGTFLFWEVPPHLSREFRFYGFMQEFHELKSRHSPAVPISEARSLTAVLDGQQRLTALNIGLLGYLATRKKYGRSNNPDAYPKRYLYLDLRHDPEEHDDDAAYRFEFLTEEQAHDDGEATWFKVGDILDLNEGAGLFKWVQQHGLADHPSAFPTLDRLWRSVHSREAVSFFEDDSASIDRVLDIFVRTNSGGTVLSKSDLLLSVATAQFTQLDARSAVHGLVDDLNTMGQGFTFTKDNVLKASLMVTDRPNIQFGVHAFTADNVAVLEERWEEVDRSLRVAVRLLSSFGFSDRTLSAASVLLPVTDYVAHRQLGENYVNSVADRADRERVRRWVTRTLLKQGIWGSGLDTLLMRLRSAIRAEGAQGFPTEALDREMAALGKSSTLSTAELEELVEVPINNRRAFPLLALLYPGVDVRNAFHIDHVFPRSRFTTRELRRAGITGDLADEYQDLRDRLPNLQLLEGPVNVAKQAQLPAEWVQQHLPDRVAREAWLAANDLMGLPEHVEGFGEFYDRRRRAMLARLVALVGDRPAPIPPPYTGPPVTTPTPPAATSNLVPPAEKHSTDHASSSTPTRTTYERRLADVGDGPITYRHHGNLHRAEVRGDTIALEDGRTFTSPTGAARAVNGDVSVNGWRVWTRNGRTLAELADS